MESTKYTHIIWDWNGTLLDDAWLCVEVMNDMLKSRNLPLLTLERYRGMFDFPVMDYYRALGFDFAREPFEVVGMEFMTGYNHRQHECKLHPEVAQILECIRSKGFHQCILSAREQNELRKETAELGVAIFFEQIDGLDDHYAHGKTEIGIRLMKELSVERNRILFIGDTLHDSDVAKELGIDCILIPNGHQSEKRLQHCGFPVLNSLPELTASLCGTTE
jgi:phosphoglycolate phosphatase